MVRWWLRLSILPLIFSLAPPVVSAAPPGGDDEELARLMKEFTSVYHAVEQNYAEPVDPQQAFYAGAIPGLLRSLDPFSAFLDPDQFQSLKAMQQSVQKGFGSVVSIGPGRVIVLQTLPGTPSARAGLSAGDEIVEINGYRLGRLDLEQLSELLRESRQHQAQLLVRRPGLATLMTFTLTPAELASPSVSRAFFLKPGVGYVKVESFDENTGEELQKAIEKLGGGKLRGLVLDLRDNPGGVVPAAIEVAATFLKPGQLILTVRGRPRPGGEKILSDGANAGPEGAKPLPAGGKQKPAEEEVRVPDDAKPLTFPLAVLINGRSASASEIVAGALQDHDRATIVGQPSFGKGLVQQVFDLSESTGLALTTALYFTPSGRSIQRPLAQLKNPNGDPQAAATHHTDAGREVKGGGGIKPDVLAAPEPLTPFRAALEASSSFLTFAQHYTSEHRSLPADFQVTPALLDDFQLFLSERQIRPTLSEWSANRDYIQNRLQTEIYNLAFGVEKGDEVEAQRDAQVQAALKALGLK